MDPNETLRRIRDLSGRVITAVDNDKPVSESVTNELAESIRDLDTWIKRGGFLPDDWMVSRR